MYKKVILDCLDIGTTTCMEGKVMVVLPVDRIIVDLLSVKLHDLFHRGARLVEHRVCGRSLYYLCSALVRMESIFLSINIPS